MSQSGRILLILDDVCKLVKKSRKSVKVNDPDREPGRVVCNHPRSAKGALPGLFPLKKMLNHAGHHVANPKIEGGTWLEASDRIRSVTL